MKDSSWQQHLQKSCLKFDLVAGCAFKTKLKTKLATLLCWKTFSSDSLKILIFSETWFETLDLLATRCRLGPRLDKIDTFRDTCVADWCIRHPPWIPNNQSGILTFLSRPLNTWLVSDFCWVAYPGRRNIPSLFPTTLVGFRQIRPTAAWQIHEQTLFEK